jgi:hypothetical protein
MALYGSLGRLNCTFANGCSGVMAIPSRFRRKLSTYLSSSLAAQDLCCVNGNLLDALWPDIHVTEANLTFHVGQLRKALGNWGDEWIKTVPKHGYRFIAPVHSGSVSEPLQTAGVASSSVGAQHVGRVEERAALTRAIDLARSGGKLVLVSGEPGVGKTTLIEDCLNEPHIRDCWLIGRGRCVELVGITEPYLPFIEALESLRATTDSGLVSELMSEHAPTWHARMLPAPASKRTIVAESRDRMHREMASFLQALSARRPVFLFLDDLHWSDPSTVDSLSFLSTRIAAMRVVIGGAYRPADMHVSGHPFGRAYPSLLSTGSCEEIAVAPLTTEDVSVLVDAAFPENPHRAELAGFAYSRSEGNPLFLIELLKHVPDGRLPAYESPEWLPDGAPPVRSDHLPKSLRGMIQRTMHQVSEKDMQLLIVAAVQGHGFDSALLARVLELDPAETERRLQHLDHAHALVRLHGEALLSDGSVNLRDRFTHVLYRDFLFGSLTPTERMRWSASVALALDGLWPQRKGQIANRIGYLWEGAREWERAATAYLDAARHAMAVFGTPEGMALARRGLAMLPFLNDDDRRAELELPLRIVLGNALIATHGYASAELEPNYSRARELCVSLADEKTLFAALYGFWVYHQMRACHRDALQLGGEFLRRAVLAGSPTLTVAFRTVGCPLFFAGRLQAARVKFVQSAAAYDPETHRHMAWLYGQESGMTTRMYLAWTLWFMGYPHRAIGEATAAWRLAVESGHKFSTCFALLFIAVLHEFRQDYKRTFNAAQRLSVLASEHGFALWTAVAPIMTGWARAMLGDGRGLEDLARGIELTRNTGARLFSPYWAGMLGEALAAHGQYAQAFAAVVHARETASRSREGIWLPELLRLQGEILARHPELSPNTDGKKCFRQALRLARAQGARSMMLRTSLAFHRLFPEVSEGPRLLREADALQKWFEGVGEGADENASARVLDVLIAAGRE